MRIVTFFLATILVALAAVIYQVKYETRSLDNRVASLQRGIAEERDVIAILRAEWSHLNRPARLERLARAHLGLRPIQGNQISTDD
jgi:cell division protein FtsL